MESSGEMTKPSLSVSKEFCTLGSMVKELIFKTGLLKPQWIEAGGWRPKNKLSGDYLKRDLT